MTWNTLGNLGGAAFSTIILNNVGANFFEVCVGTIGFLFAIGFIQRQKDLK